MSSLVDEFMAKVIAKNPGEIEFHQAVREVADSLMPFIMENPKLLRPLGFKHPYHKKLGR